MRLEIKCDDCTFTKHIKLIEEYFIPYPRLRLERIGAHVIEFTAPEKGFDTAKFGENLVNKIIREAGAYWRACSRVYCAEKGLRYGEIRRKPYE
jgi:hypothetical protein